MLTELAASLVMDPDTIQLFPDHPKITSRSKPSDTRERKRYQNRVAQRTYRRNQKEKLRALEAAVGQSSQTIMPSSTINCISNNGDSGNSDPPYEDQVSFPFLDDYSPTAVLPTLGRTALHRAVWSRNEAMTRLLLERGADIMKVDGYGQTALHLAVENGWEGLVKVLLEKITDPNVTDSSGRTALFTAVQSENEMLAKLLINASVDVNWKDSLGEVALHLAVEGGSEAMTLLLLTHGANIDA